jgi:hypothetical protein
MARPDSSEDVAGGGHFCKGCGKELVEANTGETTEEAKAGGVRIITDYCSYECAETYGSMEEAAEEIERAGPT